MMLKYYVIIEKEVCFHEAAFDAYCVGVGKWLYFSMLLGSYLFSISQDCSSAGDEWSEVSTVVLSVLL